MGSSRDVFTAGVPQAVTRTGKTLPTALHATDPLQSEDHARGVVGVYTGG